MQKNIMYVPILKWRAGEQDALKLLEGKHKSYLRPLIELVDTYNPEDFISSFNNTGTTSAYIDSRICMPDDIEYLTDIIKHSKAHSINLLPVLHYDCIEYINELIDSSVDSFALRVPIPEDIDGPSYSEIFNYLFSHDNLNIDLILDLGVIPNKVAASNQLRDLKNLFIDFLVPHSNSMNKIVIASSSFPDNLSSIEAGGQSLYPRYELKIFRHIINTKEFNILKERVVFSDYGVTKFTDSELDFSKMRYGILPKIKYTLNDEYYILKGKKNHTTKRMIVSIHDLCSQVLSSGYFFGETFSYGDNQIYEKSKPNSRPGGNKDWVTIVVTHHIAVVMEQLSNLS